MIAQLDSYQPGAFPDRVRLPKSIWATSLKGMADVVVALILLVLAGPLLLVTALLIKLTSPGPVFYSQTRLGRNRRPYRIYKIRTMIHNCERLTGPRWSTPGDPRITRMGRFLRRTHLDELPQLWNVLRGEMSLIGPRPERPEFAAKLDQAIPYYQSRLVIRPGLTGLAQVQLPPDNDLDSVRRKLAYDLYYVEHLRLWLDLQILLTTVFHVLGVPFAVPRRLLGVPSGEAVEGISKRLEVGGKAVLEMQAAR
jgi:lipopolysaccharide/colanic/teichoic acid biosynthesis glycosyltransferase